MSEKEKVDISIIVPVYNVEKYISCCINSILNQTYKNFELILIDDGSTDNSAKICKEYAILDNRIKVFHKKNEGVSKARNFGLEVSVGKYIMFCDSDDYVENTWCEELYKTILVNQNSWIMCNTCVIDYASQRKKIKQNNLDIISILEKEDYYVSMQVGFSGAIWNKIFNRKILLDNNIRKWICLIYINTKAKYVIISDENKKGIKHDLGTIDDLYNLSNELKDSLKKYL